MITLDTFRAACAADAEEITQLVNAAFRPTSDMGGWTDEAHLVSGKRITVAQLTELLSKPACVVLIAVQDSKIVTCIEIEQQNTACYIGMLAVNPVFQNAGIGKQMLAYAENYARLHFNPAKFVMSVVSVQYALIAFYLRRGYQKTGQFKNYPVLANVGIPKNDTLMLEILEKDAAVRVENTLSE